MLALYRPHHPVCKCGCASKNIVLLLIYSSQLFDVYVFREFRLKQFLLECTDVHSWTKVYTIFFQRAVTSRWREKFTICQFRNGNTSYIYKFVKCHRRRRNGHGPVPLNNEQRFKFAMSTYTRAAHHCDQRWTCVFTALKESHSGPNLQQFQLRQLSPRLTRFHGIVKFYILIHNIEETKPGHQQFHSISHHE